MARSSGRGANAVQVPVSSDQNCEVSIRKIENGYVARTSRYGDDGNYESKENFTPNKPKAHISIVEEPTAEPNARQASSPLRMAVGALKRRRK